MILIIEQDKKRDFSAAVSNPAKYMDAIVEQGENSNEQDVGCRQDYVEDCQWKVHKETKTTARR